MSAESNLSAIPANPTVVKGNLCVINLCGERIFNSLTQIPLSRRKNREICATFRTNFFSMVKGMTGSVRRYIPAGIFV